MHLDIKEALTHKIGPLPGGVWAGIAVLGIVAYVHFHKGSTSSTSSTATDPGTTALQTGGGLLGSGGDAGGGGGGSASGDAGTVTDPTPTFVPIADPGSTQYPDPNPNVSYLPPVDVLGPGTPSPQPTQTLNVSSRGVPLGTVQAPILPIGTPASVLYASVGLKASDPFTLTPPSEPQNATQTMEVAQAHAIQQAQATAKATGHAVAV